ncbi:MAG: hypothetical protein CL878_05430 [Dehalococcoidia bacterium]|nr:hypothetical protein [Dehalococcoidia bacterium]
MITGSQTDDPPRCLKCCHALPSNGDMAAPRCEHCGLTNLGPVRQVYWTVDPGLVARSQGLRALAVISGSMIVLIAFSLPRLPPGVIALAWSSPFILWEAARCIVHHRRFIAPSRAAAIVFLAAAVLLVVDSRHRAGTPLDGRVAFCGVMSLACLLWGHRFATWKEWWRTTPRTLAASAQPPMPSYPFGAIDAPRQADLPPLDAYDYPKVSDPIPRVPRRPSKSPTCLRCELPLAPSPPWSRCPGCGLRNRPHLRRTYKTMDPRKHRLEWRLKAVAMAVTIAVGILVLGQTFTAGTGVGTGAGWLLAMPIALGVALWEILSRITRR